MWQIPNNIHPARALLDIQQNIQSLPEPRAAQTCAVLSGTPGKPTRWLLSQLDTMTSTHISIIHSCCQCWRISQPYSSQGNPQGAQQERFHLVFSVLIQPATARFSSMLSCLLLIAFKREGEILPPPFIGFSTHTPMNLCDFFPVTF